MRQGDGSELLGPGDPRNPDIGILHVESRDSRQEILTAISTQELQGRKQIAIVLPEQGKAFRQPVDFDGLKNMRRQLKAQLIFIAPSGPGPAEFARQRRFPVYSSLETFKSALLNEGIPSGNQRVKTNPGGGKRPGLLGLGSGKSRPGQEGLQATPPTPHLPVQPPISPIPPAPRVQNQQTPPAAPLHPRRPGQSGPRSSARALPPMPPIEDMKTIEIDQTSGPGTMGATGAGMLAASSLSEDDDEMLAPPAHPTAPAPPSPIAQGSATPTGPAVGPARPADPPSRPPQESRAVPDIIVFPTATPAATPKTTGKIHTIQGTAGRSSGTLPASPASAGTSPPQGAPPAGRPQNPPTGRNGAAGGMATVAAAGIAPAIAATPVPVPSAGAGTGIAAAGGSGGPAAGPPPASLTPLPSPYSRRSRRRRWQRTALLLFLLLFLGGALTVGIFAAQGKIPGLPGSLTAHVTITPLSTLEADNYLLEALPTGTPDPARRQIGARLLTQTSGTATATATATGSTPATRASGILTFQNVGASNAHVDPGVLTGADGVPITFYQSLTVAPSGSPTVIGYAVNLGAAGNIVAFDLDGRCCAPNVFVKNLAPFSGGHEAVPNSVIQQSDIDTAARPLITPLQQSTESALQAQITPGERVVDQSVPPCTPTIHPSVPAGTTAKTVTVSVQVTCHEEVYDSTAAQSMTTTLLRSRAEHDPALTAPYTLQGQILTSVLSATVVTAGGQVSLEIEARGIWVYRLADQEQQQIKRALIALSKEHALSVLHHERGVAAATISISNGTIMPPNAGDIILVIQAPPGAQASPTSTAGTRPTVPPTGPGLTPTPVNGLGGS